MHWENQTVFQMKMSSAWRVFSSFWLSTSNFGLNLWKITSKEKVCRVYWPVSTQIIIYHLPLSLEYEVFCADLEFGEVYNMNNVLAKLQVENVVCSPLTIKILMSSETVC